MDDSYARRYVGESVEKNGSSEFGAYRITKGIRCLASTIERDRVSYFRIDGRRAVDLYTTSAGDFSNSVIASNLENHNRTLASHTTWECRDCADYANAERSQVFDASIIESHPVAYRYEFVGGITSNANRSNICTTCWASGKYARGTAARTSYTQS